MRHAWMFAMVVGVLAGCTPEDKPPAAAEKVPAVNRNVERALVVRGAELYKQHCANCHGARAEGAPNWQRPGPDGKYPAPPLDGSGHAWHHPRTALEQTIRSGTLKLGGSMPAWKDKLTDDDIEAAIAWMQSLWPEEIYRAWLAMDEKSRKGLTPH